MIEILVIVLSFFLTAIIGLGTYAYTRDMSYLKARMTEIALGTEKRFDEDHEDNAERFRIVHKRLDDHEERLRENEATINKELK